MTEYFLNCWLDLNLASGHQTATLNGLCDRPVSYSVRCWYFLVLWRQLQESNPRPTDYKFGRGHIRTFSIARFDDRAALAVLSNCYFRIIAQNHDAKAADIRHRFAVLMPY